MRFFLRMGSAAITFLIAVTFFTSISEAIEVTSGTLVGRVTDDSGTKLPRAVITITGTTGSKSVMSDEDGRFIIPDLNPGDYTVRAEKSGLSTIEQKNVLIRLGSRTEISFKMKVGIRETVNVSGVPIVDPTSTGPSIHETLNIS